MLMHTEDDRANAIRLMRAIEGELDLGTKFFNQAGKQLTNIKTVILALRDEGKVTTEPTPERAEAFREMAAAEVIGSGIGGILWTPQ